ncbi:hypothetical protein GQ600_13883 [Phytophthora cactorum]|nr:hypothetical protein GQ600_13883 [Phytophthora cactorum]
MVYRTPQEKMLIVHTHKYFLAEAQQRLDHLGRAVRERVAKLWRFRRAWLRIICSELKTLKGGAYVEQQPPSEIAPAPTMEELQDLAGEVSDKVHCSNIMGEMDTSAQFEEFEIAL